MPLDHRAEGGVRHHVLSRLTQGSSLSYYTNLQELDPEIKDLFLKSINDIVLNKDFQSKAFQEDVTKKSLLRYVNINIIRNQYRRVLVRPESTLSGVTTFEDIENGVYICYIEDFCDDLKSKIRQMLGSIYHGEKAFADNDVFTYQKTVQNFLSKYNTKSPSTQKGIIGELLAHLLIPNYTELLPVSIMKNKEENSIRKGFDIVYHNQARSLWYCEVKSGGDENIEENPNQKNCSLLSAAKKDITNHSVGKRVSLWESVLIDIEFTIPNVNNRTEIRAMLNSHHPDCNERVMDRNVILCSVLYKSLDHKIDEKRLKEFKRSSTQDSNFKGLLIVSIQKETYKRVEEFLNSELKGVTY